MDSIVIDQTFLACMFCLPISDHWSDGTPENCFFQCRFCTCTHMSGCMHNYIKDKSIPEERWENKTNKLMTLSCIRASVSLLKERILNFYVININFTWRNITRQNTIWRPWIKIYVDCSPFISTFVINTNGDLVRMPKPSWAPLMTAPASAKILKNTAR